MLKDVVSSNFYIKVVSFFPCFLDKLGSYIVLTHFVDQIFQLGSARGGVNQYISLWVPWAMPEALYILVVHLCMFEFLCVGIGVMGLRGVAFCSVTSHAHSKPFQAASGQQNGSWGGSHVGIVGVFMGWGFG